MEETELKNRERKRRQAELKNAKPEILINNKKKSEKLKIAYVMAWTGVCGGSKIIFEHANNLTQRGHEVVIICHDERPNWFKLNNEVEFIQVPLDKIVGEYVPKYVDLIVCSASSSIYECIQQRIAPVVYFEQGDHHLFNREIVDDEKLKFIADEYAICNNIFTVSSYAREKIMELYSKDSKIIPNAVDKDIFYFENHKEHSSINITAIGGENWEFKGIKYILKAVEVLKQKHDIHFTWVTPTVPKTKIEKTIVNPEQIVIGNTLRNTDIYICASFYEAFCLPVLEAMNCGAAIITTDNGGNRDFAINNETCLLVNKMDAKDIVDKVEMLISNPALKNKIVKNSLEKAKQYDWEKIIDQLEQYYREISTYSVK